MICASLYRAVFIKNLLRYLAEKILLLNTTNFRGDYHLSHLQRAKFSYLVSLGAHQGISTAISTDRAARL
jgi:hypothetical protein